MGCDIHAYVEYVAFGAPDNPYWSCIMQNIGHRDYEFFSLIADCGRGSHRPVFENRGLPEGKMSYIITSTMWLVISDELAMREYEGYCSEAEAMRWGKIEAVNDHYRRVLHPDLHSHTWLTCDEFAQVIGAYITQSSGDHPYGVEWDAALAAMRALEERGHTTRIIFAFDN